jgi:hypothetical protein
MLQADEARPREDELGSALEDIAKAKGKGAKGGAERSIAIRKADEVKRHSPHPR